MIQINIADKESTVLSVAKHIRVLAALVVFLLCGYLLPAQTPAPVQPTSATDSEVKIHSYSKGFLVRKDKRWRKFRGEARATERAGRSYRKQKRVSKSEKVRNDGKVFQRHSQAARRRKQQAYKTYE